VWYQSLSKPLKILPCQRNAGRYLPPNANLSGAYNSLVGLIKKPKKHDSHVHRAYGTCLFEKCVPFAVYFWALVVFLGHFSQDPRSNTPLKQTLANYMILLPYLVYVPLNGGLCFQIKLVTEEITPHGISFSHKSYSPAPIKGVTLGPKSLK
jgi:hypothetical protein